MEFTVKEALAEFFAVRNDTICYIIVCFGIGAVLAAVCAMIEKNGVGRLVRGLLERGAQSPLEAVSLNELGLGKSPACRFALRKNSPLWYLISCDVKTAKKAERLLYIPPQNTERAKTAYRKKGNSPWMLALCLVLIALCVFLLLLAEPHLKEFAKGVFEKFGAR